MRQFSDPEEQILSFVLRNEIENAINCFIPLLYIGTIVEMTIKQTGFSLQLHIDDHNNTIVEEKAKIRNRYNQVLYLTRNSICESDK